MSAPIRLPSPRYRHRILGAGLIAAGALYSFGAPLYVGRIEDDLTQRVPEELADAGFAGITAEFDGQDGTLTCSQPLDDPEGANEAAYDVWGVRSITLDRSCRVNIAAGSDSDIAGAVGITGSTSTATTGATGAYATVIDLMDHDPRVSFFAMLLHESALGAELGDADAVTVLAPTDDAFEALPADEIAGLRSDPELLSRVLARHIAFGNVPASQLAAGGATIVDADLTAGNGVVHVIDSVLIPDDVDLSALHGSS